MHDLLRDYARTLAATDPPSECEAALDRLLDYYLHTATLAATHFPQRTSTTHPGVAHPPSALPELATRDTAVSWLETERANLRAATDYAVLHARYQHAIYLPAALYEFLRARGPWGQALALGHIALEAARTVGDRHGEAHTLTDLGRAQLLTDDYSAAIASLRQALALFSELGDRYGEAFAFNNLGRVQYSTDDYSAAIASHKQALELFRKLGDRLGQAEALNDLGRVLCTSGGVADARAQHGQALGIARALGTPLEEARALEGIGHCHFRQGQGSEANVCLRQALALYRRLGCPGAQRVETTLATQALHGSKT